jgi:Na+(H+)/acetate symporter ActP
MGIIELFTTLFVLSSGVVILAEYITKFTKVSGTLAQVQSWAVSIIIGIFCSWLNFGVFHGTTTMGGVLYGVLIGLISNGIFDITLVKKVLAMIYARSNDVKDELLKS